MPHTYKKCQIVWRVCQIKKWFFTRIEYKGVFVSQRKTYPVSIVFHIFHVCHHKCAVPHNRTTHTKSDLHISYKKDPRKKTRLLFTANQHQYAAIKETRQNSTHLDASSIDSRHIYYLLYLKTEICTPKKTFIYDKGDPWKKTHVLFAVYRVCCAMVELHNVLDLLCHVTLILFLCIPQKRTIHLKGKIYSQKKTFLYDKRDPRKRRLYYLQCIVSVVPWSSCTGPQIPKKKKNLHAASSGYNVWHIW